MSAFRRRSLPPVFPWGEGTATRRLEDVGRREDVGLGDAGREDVINKKHPNINDPLHLSLLKYQVRGPNLRLQHAKLISFMCG